MKLQRLGGIERKVQLIRRRYPWVASLIVHCLRTKNPQAYEAMRMVLARLRLSGI